jgi:hypothetical protein
MKVDVIRGMRMNVNALCFMFEKNVDEYLDVHRWMHMNEDGSA